MNRIHKMDELKLFGYKVSPYVHRIEVALKLKGIPYEYIEEDLSHKSHLLLKSNPVHKKVPVLLHNGKAIAESAVIFEYIEETWKTTNPILPNDPYARAMARFFTKFIDEKCFPPLWKACWSSGEEQEKAKEEGSELLNFLEDELKDKKFFGGDKIGMVDIFCNFIAFWLITFQEEVGLELLTKDKFPRLWEWAEMYVNSSTVNECLPPKDKLIDRFRFILVSKQMKKN